MKWNFNIPMPVVVEKAQSLKTKLFSIVVHKWVWMLGYFTLVSSAIFIFNIFKHYFYNMSAYSELHFSVCNTG